MGEGKHFTALLQSALPLVYPISQLEHLERRAACLSITIVSVARFVPCELACRADRTGPGFPRFDFGLPFVVPLS